MGIDAHDIGETAMQPCVTRDTKIRKVTGRQKRPNNQLTDCYLINLLVDEISPPHSEHRTSILKVRLAAGDKHSSSSSSWWTPMIL